MSTVIARNEAASRADWLNETPTGACSGKEARAGSATHSSIVHMLRLTRTPDGQTEKNNAATTRPVDSSIGFSRDFSSQAGEQPHVNRRNRVPPSQPDFSNTALRTDALSHTVTTQPIAGTTGMTGAVWTDCGDTQRRADTSPVPAGLFTGCGLAAPRPSGIPTSDIFHADGLGAYRNTIWNTLWREIPAYRDILTDNPGFVHPPARLFVTARSVAPHERDQAWEPPPPRPGAGARKGGTGMTPP